jgi:PIN domain nuclease of toxin-antitoxin system
VNTAVLDASALLAFLQEEPGAEQITPRLLCSASISAVNYSEVYSKLIWGGLSAAQADECLQLPFHIVQFDHELAKTCGALIRRTAQYGLSLGDRACLALAISIKAPVYTTEKIWKNLKVGIPIHVIR